MDKLPKIPIKALRDFYKLSNLIGKINGNYMNDYNNPDRADKHYKFIKEANEVTQRWIDANPPLDFKIKK